MDTASDVASVFFFLSVFVFKEKVSIKGLIFIVWIAFGQSFFYPINNLFYKS